MASRVLRDVTNYKRTQLDERREKFEQRKAQLLEEASTSSDAVATLIKGLEDLGCKVTTAPTSMGGYSLDNLRLLHQQSKHDASIPPTVIHQWQKDLKRLLDIQSLKYEYAVLFSKLATEWVDKPNEANLLLDSSLGDDSSNDSASEDSQSFEPIQVGREEMHQQRQQWDSLVFTERQTDTAAIKKYLTDLFTEPKQAKRVNKTPFDVLREGFAEDDDLECSWSDVQDCIKAVLKADLFSGQKRDELVALRDASGPVLCEIADVINMELANLRDWTWKPTPIPAQMRRQLNGKYRVYMNPEIHQALLVQWIGINFALSVKHQFTSFFRSKAWPKAAHNAMSSRDHVRASYYLGEDSDRFQNSVLYTRREQYKDDFFLTQLPSSLSEGNRDYNAPDEETRDDQEGKSPLEVKQTLLRLATTELMVQKKIYGSFTLCQTDFKWFGPSLPHSTIFTVLKFLGVQDAWLDFFNKFLTMPLIFPQDGPNAEVRTRHCGVPISQALSDAFGEAILACLDFSVSKATSGRCQLYRFHDDIWFWGQRDDCEVAWQTIKTFTDVMGLALNEEKTGSIHVSDKDQDQEPSTVLPKGPVRWGFLVLDPIQSHWVVDRDQVDAHVTEMRRQFAQCRSTMSWIQAWNTYIGRFLSNNFGHPANCLGTQHLDMIFSTFQSIQQKLFQDSNGGMGHTDVTSYIKARIEKDFGTKAKDVANAFLYWPVEFGGLDLRNPFISLMTKREESYKVPMQIIDAAFEEDEERYEEAKEKFNRDMSKRRAEVPSGCDPENFLSFDEFVKFREETSLPLTTAYKKLLESPAVKGVEATRPITTALASIPLENRNHKAFKSQTTGMDEYWKWMLQLYAGETVERFGGLPLSEKEMLPVELVNLMRSERVRWQG